MTYAGLVGERRAESCRHSNLRKLDLGKFPTEIRLTASRARSRVVEETSTDPIAPHGQALSLESQES